MPLQFIELRDRSDWEAHSDGPDVIQQLHVIIVANVIPRLGGLAAKSLEELTHANHIAPKIACAQYEVRRPELPEKARQRR